MPRKTDAIYCGVGNAPKGRRVGTMSECAKAKQIRKYGERKIDPRTLAAAKLTKPTLVAMSRDSLIKKRASLLGSKRRFEGRKESKNEDVRKEAEKQLKVINKELPMVEAELRKRLAAKGADKAPAKAADKAPAKSPAKAADKAPAKKETKATKSAKPTFKDKPPPKIKRAPVKKMKNKTVAAPKKAPAKKAPAKKAAAPKKGTDKENTDFVKALVNAKNQKERDAIIKASGFFAK